MVSEPDPIAGNCCFQGLISERFPQGGSDSSRCPSLLSGFYVARREAKVDGKFKLLSNHLLLSRLSLFWVF